jgi:hypothetical protein
MQKLKWKKSTSEISNSTPLPPITALFLLPVHYFFPIGIFTKLEIGKFQIVCNRLTISANSSAKKIARHIFRFMAGFLIFFDSFDNHCWK